VADPLVFEVETEHRGKRLDAFLHEKLPDFSRSRIQDWIKSGRVRVNGSEPKPSFTLRGSERVEVEPAALPPLRAEAEELPLSVLYEDEYMVAIDKAAGMVVHAGAGITHGTVVNALLHRFSTLSSLGGELRPGIVHRLDRYTSGILLVAKTDLMHQKLAHLFASRRMRKTYLALVHRPMRGEKGRIEKPIARDPVHRARMTARLESGRPAWSEWKVLERFPDFSYLQVLIGTGRTHQIRVHLSSIGHPVVGDRLYGAPAHVEGIDNLDRYFLHAHQIEFTHPVSGQDLSITSPLPGELESWLERLRRR
jgi:23S rRNA pseudouridine1911/1915/1917 synthase